MKVTVNWRRVFRAYLRFLAWYLPIGLVPLAFIVGLKFHDLGWGPGWRHFVNTLPILGEMVEFKLKLYGALAAIVFAITAIGDFIGAYFGLLRPAPGRTDEAAIGPVERARRRFRDDGLLASSKRIQALPRP
jgi:hypothetical protein